MLSSTQNDLTGAKSGFVCSASMYPLRQPPCVWSTRFCVLFMYGGWAGLCINSRVVSLVTASRQAANKNHENKHKSSRLIELIETGASRPRDWWHTIPCTSRAMKSEACSELCSWETSEPACVGEVHFQVQLPWTLGGTNAERTQHCRGKIEDRLVNDKWHLGMSSVSLCRC